MEAEIQKRLQKIQELILLEDGLTARTYVRDLISNDLVPKEREQEAIAAILGAPTLTTVYEGARLALEKMIHGESDVILWTQGDPQVQIAKCDTSRLLDLNEDQNKRGSISISAHNNKAEGIAPELTTEKLLNKTHLVFVDDKSSQLVAAYQSLLKLRESDHKDLPADILYIWMRRPENTKYKDLLPEGFESEEQLSKFIGGHLLSASKPEDIPVIARTLYFIDLDRTLIDADLWLKNVQERIALEFV